MTSQNNGPADPNDGRNQGNGQQGPNHYQQAYENGYRQGFQNAQNGGQNPNQGQNGNPYAGETFGRPGPDFGPQNGPQSAWQRFSQRDQFHWDLGSIASSVIKKTRNTFIWGGVILFAIGLLVLLFPGKSANAMTVILGIVFGVMGVLRLVSAFTASGTPAGWRVLDGLAGLLLIISCVFVFRNLHASTGILLIMASIMIGISWIVEGFTAIVEGAGFMGTGWSIFSGIVSILGGTVLLFWPMSSMYALVIFIAVMLMVYGFIGFIRGLNMPKVDADGNVKF